MLHPTQAYNRRQVYRRDDVAEIFHCSPSFLDRHDGGDVPLRLRTVPVDLLLWSRAAVWRHLGLPLPDVPVPGATDFLPTRSAAELLGVSQNAVADAAKDGKIPGVAMIGLHWAIPVASVVAMIGHPLVLWPNRQDDPAFRAVPRRADAAPVAPPSVPAPSQALALLDEAAFRRILAEVVTADWSRAVAVAFHDAFVGLEDRVNATVQGAVRAEMAIQIESGALRVHRADLQTVRDLMRDVLREFVAGGGRVDLRRAAEAPAARTGAGTDPAPTRPNGPT